MVWEDQLSSQAGQCLQLGLPTQFVITITAIVFLCSKSREACFQFSFCDHGDFVEKLLLAVVIELFEHTVASRFACQDLTAVVLACPAKT